VLGFRGRAIEKWPEVVKRRGVEAAGAIAGGLIFLLAMQDLDSKELDTSQLSVNRAEAELCFAGPPKAPQKQPTTNNLTT